MDFTFPSTCYGDFSGWQNDVRLAKSIRLHDFLAFERVDRHPTAFASSYLVSRDSGYQSITISRFSTF